MHGGFVRKDKKSGDLCICQKEYNDDVVSTDTGRAGRPEPAEGVICVDGAFCGGGGLSGAGVSTDAAGLGVSAGRAGFGAGFYAGLGTVSAGFTTAGFGDRKR